MKAKQALRALCAVTIAAFTSAILAATATAQVQQNVKPPAGLQWQQMNEIVFNSTNLSSTGTDEERTLLAKIWAKEIQGTQKSPINGSLLPSFALIGSVAHQDETVVLSIFDRAGYSCIAPGNGRDMINIYATCPLRIVRLLSNNQAKVQNLPTNFCMIFGDDPNTPRTKNHNEYAYDEHTGIVYLRTIQYGKVVPECNRAIQVFKR